MNNRVLCNTREKPTKGGNNRLRVNGKIPGIIYGMSGSNINIELEELELFHLISEIGEHSVVEIELNGKFEKVLLKDIQRDPLTRKLTHVDFQRFDTNKKIHTHVPIVIRGEETLHNFDAILQRQADNVEVECTPGDIPKFIAVDVSNMIPGQRITYGNIELSSEISIVGDINTVIAAITRKKLANQNDEESDLDIDSFKEASK
jgi:large subunit ribosomal protein L25